MFAVNQSNAATPFVWNIWLRRKICILISSKVHCRANRKYRATVKKVSDGSSSWLHTIINIVFCFASFVQVSVIPETFGKSNAPAISGYANTLSSCVTKTPVPIWPYRDAPSVVQSMVKWKWLARMIHTQPPNGKQSKVSTFMHAMQPIPSQFIPNSKSIYI